MTHPIHPDHLSGRNKLGKRSFGTDVYCLFFNSSSSITPPWGKLSNLWAPCVYSLWPRVPSWIWIKWIQYATHRNNFSRLQYCCVDCDAKFAPTPSYFISGQHFLEIFTLLPETARTHKLTVTTIVSVLNQQHDFCYTMANISPSHAINNALT